MSNNCENDAVKKDGVYTFSGNCNYIKESNYRIDATEDNSTDSKTFSHTSQTPYNDAIGNVQKMLDLMWIPLAIVGLLLAISKVLGSLSK